jgi:hypothetical protein
MEEVSRFSIGERVRLLRDLPSLPADSEGVVRGVSANASGVNYAIRFDKSMRIVAERDLGASARSR